MSRKQTPWWDSGSPARINELRRRQISRYLITLADGSQLVKEAHDFDLTPNGLVFKRILGSGPKVTAWQCELVLPPGSWREFSEVTDWNEMVAMPPDLDVIEGGKIIDV